MAELPDPTLGLPRRIAAGLGFVGFTLWELLISNLRLAWIVVQFPEERMRDELHPGIAAVPLRADGPWETLILATAITLTPGTVSIDIEPDPEDLGDGDPDNWVLYVHGLRIHDPDDFRREIAEGFEARLLRASRGVQV